MRHSLSEGYKNLFDLDEKQRYARQAYDQLQRSYAPIGGLKGNGFKTFEQFFHTIPFWKLKVQGDHILAAAYYKDNEGRKRVAVSTDGTPAGKKALAVMMIDDLKLGRAYSETSSSAIRFLVRHLGEQEVVKYAVPLDRVAAKVHDELRAPPSDDIHLRQFPLLAPFFYQRQLGDHWHTKVMLGA